MIFLKKLNNIKLNNKKYKRMKDIKKLFKIRKKT